ncbi:MAG TPA: hypothetical protein VM118_13655, partial [Acidobacteriota bacterium]|nr:hypothetical protein [Acidobacteriota bacterium]
MKRVTAIALLVVLAAVVCARADDTGTESPFSFGVGARELSLGGANVATSDFTGAPYWNASRLAQTDRYTFSVFHSRLYESDVAYQYVGLAIPTLDFGSFGVGVARLGIGGIEQRDGNNAFLGTTRDDRLGLFFAYGRTVSGYDLGLSLSFEHHNLDNYSATSSPGLNLSVSRRLALHAGWLHGLTLAVTGANIVRPAMNLVGERVQYPYQLDGAFSLDLSPRFESSSGATVSACIRKTEARSPAVALGLEVDLKNRFFARSGFRDGHPSIGAGLVYGSMRFDYGLVGRDLGALHMFTISTALGTSVSEKRRRRAERREAEFATLMSEQVQSRNDDLIRDLVAQGEERLAQGDLDAAIQRLDRALFLAGSADADTTRISALLHEARANLESQTRSLRFAEYLDSANAKYQASDYLAARYFATLALDLSPDSEQAAMWLAQADEAIAETASADEVLQRHLTEIDSLLSYGQVDRALTAARTLVEYAPDNAAVQSAVRRVRFEHWRTAAADAHDHGHNRTALSNLDSALALYPGHQWCEDLRVRIRTDMSRPAVPQTTEAVVVARTLNPEVRKEVEQAYQEGQKAFRAGNLAEALSHWEMVDRVAPNHESVRSYLIKA